MKKKVEKNKDITNLELLESINRSISKMEDRMSTMENKLGSLDQSVQVVRRDILNIGDKFVSHHVFDQLALRVTKLEKKK